MLQHKFWAMIVVLLGLGLAGFLMHRHQPQQSAISTGKVSWKMVDRVADYYATLAPETATWVASPVSGHIAKMSSSFGEMVAVNQVLMHLEDPKIQEGYVSSVTDYLQAKDALKRSKKSLKGESSLLHLGAISQKSYEDVQQTYEKNYLAWLKSKMHLARQLALVHIDFAEVEQLKFSDLHQIETMLATNKTVLLMAKTSGLLLPIEGSEKHKSIKEGSKVEMGDVVAMIVPKSKFIVRLTVPEGMINAFHQGMSVTMTGEAFTGFTLKGQIAEVGSYHVGGKQAQVAQFPVQVSVTDIPKEAMKRIRLGMHVRVHCVLSHSKALVVPIQAVAAKDHRYIVTVKRHDQWVDVPVETGQVSGNDVTIKGDLKAGELIVEHH